MSSDGRRIVIRRRDVLRGGGAFAVAWLWAGCWEGDDSSATQAPSPEDSGEGGPDASTAAVDADAGQLPDTGSASDGGNLGDGGGAEADGAPTTPQSGRPTPQSATAPDERVPILWIETGVCTGCAISLLNETGVENLLPDLRFEFQETLMEGSGNSSVEGVLSLVRQLSGKYVLLVDGAIATGDKAHMTVLGVDGNGTEWTAERFVLNAALGAKHIVSLGTCASWGGIPSAAPNPGNHCSLPDMLAKNNFSVGKKLIRVPGCPPRSDWIKSVLVDLVQDDDVPDLDGLGRPKEFFGATIHSQCPRLGMYDLKKFADHPGDTTQCLRKVGCKGPICYADCVKKVYVDGAHCILANHPCLGCAAPGFPDAHPIGTETHSTSPFYTALPEGL